MKISKFYLLVASLFAAGIFGGCTAYEQAVVANALTGGAAYNDPYYYNGYNYGANRDSRYRNGVQDGCSSKRGVWRKDTYQYSNYYSYRDGWNAGYNQCSYWGGGGYGNTSYNNGYSDGCWSRRYVGIRKNSYQYRYNSSYRNGWNNGYRECR